MSRCDFKIAKQFNFLKSMTESERSELVAASASRVVQKGDVIFMEDQQLHQLFCIREGACKFSTIDEKGNEHITKLLGKGELMGRRALISKKGALVTATALTDSTICYVDKNSFLSSLCENNAFCMDVLKGFIADAEEDAKKMALFENHRSIKKRLAGLLLYLVDKFGADRNGSLHVFLKREDMAGILGTSSEYVISLLTQFKDLRLVDLERGQIIIMNMAALRKIV